MQSIFNEGPKEDIAAVLAAKDKRVAMQQTIFKAYPQAVLVNVNLNIPGPIKNNDYLEKIFAIGSKKLVQDFRRHHLSYRLVAQWQRDTGPENFYILKAKAKKIKLICIDFEDSFALGRLFDADVLVKSQKMALSRKDLGLPVRKCFLCGRPAKECARSRRHSVKAMQAYISKLYWRYAD